MQYSAQCVSFFIGFTSTSKYIQDLGPRQSGLDQNLWLEAIPRPYVFEELSTLARALPRRFFFIREVRTCLFCVFVSQAGYKTHSDSTPSTLRRKHGPGGTDGGDKNEPQERVGGGATYRLPQLHSRYDAHHVNMIVYSRFL